MGATGLASEAPLERLASAEGERFRGIFERHSRRIAMSDFARITLDPEVMGGKPCIRGLRITVGTVIGLLASGRSEDDILGAYPYLDRADIRAALAYATWRVEEREVMVGSL